MAKENISATVDPEVAEFLSKSTVNASGVVNRAVKREMGILDSNDNEMLKLRLEQIREEREDLENRAERKAELEKRLERRVESEEQERKTRRQEVVDRCVKKWAYLPESADTEAVKVQAEKAGMEPEAFYEAVKEEFENA